MVSVAGTSGSGNGTRHLSSAALRDKSLAALEKRNGCIDFLFQSSFSALILT